MFLNYTHDEGRSTGRSWNKYRPENTCTGVKNFLSFRRISDDMASRDRFMDPKNFAKCHYEGVSGKKRPKIRSWRTAFPLWAVTRSHYVTNRETDSTPS